ncbi:hypothetical protein U3516DRAFT_760893 [Neocallimastix sp. 'constans']
MVVAVKLTYEIYADNFNCSCNVVSRNNTAFKYNCLSDIICKSFHNTHNCFIPACSFALYACHYAACICCKIYPKYCYVIYSVYSLSIMKHIYDILDISDSNNKYSISTIFIQISNTDEIEYFELQGEKAPNKEPTRLICDYIVLISSLINSVKKIDYGEHVIFEIRVGLKRLKDEYEILIKSKLKSKKKKNLQ